MKKLITSLLVAFLLISSNAFSGNLYLIANNGTTWTSTPTGFDNVYKVDLSNSGTNGTTAVSLTQWLNDRNAAAPTYLINGIAGVTFTTADQIWIAAGTYNVAIAWSILSGSSTPTPGSIYGGFAGNENTTSERSKGANAWNFTNETYIHGTAAVNLFYAASDRTITFDGMTMDGFTNAIYQRGNMNIQNCKFSNNTNSAVLFFNGTNNASVKDSYFYQNTVSGTSTNGAAISTSTTSTTAIYTISGCLFENNTSTSTGNSSSASLRITAGTGGTYTCNISNCIFKNNKNTGSSGSGRSSVLTIYSNVLTVNVSNCLAYGDLNNPGNIDAVYMVAGNITNCTFVNNYKGMYIPASGTVKLKNVVLWGVEEGVTARLLSPGGIGAGGTSANITLDNCAYRTVGTVGANNSPVTLALANTGASGSPYFTDPDNNVWTLASGSPLIDMGTATGAPGTDLIGTSRPQGGGIDIGAYERTTTTALADIKKVNWLVRDGNLIINGLETNQPINIFDIAGKKVFSANAGTNVISVPLRKGIYIVNINNSNTKIAVN